MLSPMNALTPRNRQEIEPFRLLKTRRLVGIKPVDLGATTIVTARPNAFYAIEGLGVANVTATDATYSLYVVTGAEPITAANAIVFGASIAANTSSVIDVVTGMALAPGQTLVATCSVDGAVNIFGQGWDVMGDMQSS